MIARRRVDEVEEEEEDEMQPLTGYNNSIKSTPTYSKGLPNTIFAGLNFPSVPTNPIILTRENQKIKVENESPPNYEDYAQSTYNYQSSTQSTLDDERPLLDSSNTPQYIVEVASAPEISVDDPVFTAVDSKPNLSKLYHSVVVY
jgi:hypothetical protein